MTDPLIIPEGITTNPGSFDTIAVSPKAPRVEADSDPGFFRDVWNRMEWMGGSSSIGRFADQTEASITGDYVDLDFDTLYSELESEGLTELIQPEHIDGFRDVRTQQELELKMAALKGRLESDRELASRGGLRAFMVDMAASTVDPLNLAIDVASGGSTKAGSFAYRFAQAGSRAAAANALIEGVLMAGDDTQTLADVGVAAVAGLTFGGLLGGVLGRSADPKPHPALPDNPTTQIDVASFRVIDEDARSVGAAMAQDNEFFRSPTFMVPRHHADDVLFRNGSPDWADGDSDAALTKLTKNMTPATRARFERNPHAKAMLNTLFTQPWATRGTVNQEGTEDIAKRIFHDAEARRLQGQRPLYNQWYRDQHRRGWVRRSFDGEAEAKFSQEVGEYIRLEGDVPDAHPSIRAAAQVHKDYYDRLWRRLQDNNVVPKDMAPPKDFYLPQIVDKSKVSQFVRTNGSSRGMKILRGLYREAIVSARQRAGDEIDDDLTDVVSRAMALRAYRVDPSHHGAVSDDLLGMDIEDLDSLANYIDSLRGIASDGEVDEVADLLKKFQEKLENRTDAEKNAPDRLRKRINLDMNVSVTAKDPDGVDQTYRLMDLYDNDSTNLAHMYGRWAGGESAFHNKGSSSHEAKRVIEELTHEAQQLGLDTKEGKALMDAVEDIEYGFRSTMGLRAHEANETFTRVASSAKSITYALRMGSAFFHGLGEAWTIVAQRSVLPFIREDLPELGRIISSLRNGTADRGLIDDILMLDSSLLNSFEFTQAGARFETDMVGAASNKLVRFMETMGEGSKRVMSMVNMMPVTSDITRRLSAVSSMRQLDDILARGKKAPSLWDGYRKQLALSDEGMETLRRHLNSDKVTRDSSGRLQSLGAMDTETAAVLESYLYRSVSTAIQEVSRGNLPRMMTHPAWSTLLQFRSFEMASTTRHLGADINRADWLAANKFLGTAVIATMLAGVRTMLYTADEEKREEAMRPDRLIRQGIAYSVSAGIIPSVVDVLSNRTAGSPVFGRQRTTGISDDLIEGSGVGVPPALATASNILEGTLGVPASMFREEVFGDGWQGISKEQARATASIVGANNLWFLRPFTERVINDLPTERELDRATLETYLFDE